ncbi:hypothetical protein JT358_04500 [Micrococcales bacterium 31B]|nr:hypothetical protein [Micrococcales bacterium 31B]
MNAVQDWVVDETRRAWPELHLATGESLAVLSPLRTESGVAVWAANSVRVPVGSLDRWEGSTR